MMEPLEESCANGREFLKKNSADKKLDLPAREELQEQANSLLRINS